MRSNSKQVRSAIDSHILDCVYNYEENNFETLKEACKHLNSEFIRVANHPYNLKRYPNVQDRFSDYLNGLPFHFHYENIEIDDYLNGIGINPAKKDFESEKSLKMYHYLIFSQMNKNLKK